MPRPKTKKDIFPNIDLTDVEIPSNVITKLSNTPPARDERGDKTPAYVLWMFETKPAEAKEKYKTWLDKLKETGNAPEEIKALI